MAWVPCTKYRSLIRQLTSVACQLSLSNSEVLVLVLILLALALVSLLSHFLTFLLSDLPAILLVFERGLVLSYFFFLVLPALVPRPHVFFFFLMDLIFVLLLHFLIVSSCKVISMSPLPILPLTFIILTLIDR